MTRSARIKALAAVAVALGVVTAMVGCGSDTTEVQRDGDQVVVKVGDGDFNPAEIYANDAPGVVTVLSLFGGGSGNAGQGSGFVISDEGEILTNAHVVTSGGAGNGGGEISPAEEVFVEFADRNRVEAEIIGFDPDADVALIKVDPGEIDLDPLQLSERNAFAVGEPVAAIGSPFGKRQSLSVGVISANDRTIESLTEFSIDNAIQTDTSINPGNSGGPLLDAAGDVIGMNQQIQTSSGSNSGVGFAIPIDIVRHSLEGLRADGVVDYAYLGVSTEAVWPQLAEELDLGSSTGALVSEVVPGGPAAEAGIKGATGETTFQGSPVATGGDLIVAVDGKKIIAESDLAEVISRQEPGSTVTLEIIRDGERLEVSVELAERPGS
jgi:S1-C subfamily serine protease